MQDYRGGDEMWDASVDMDTVFWLESLDRSGTTWAAKKIAGQ